MPKAPPAPTAILLKAIGDPGGVGDLAAKAAEASRNWKSPPTRPSPLPEEIIQAFSAFCDVSIDEYESCARHVGLSLAALPEDRLVVVRAALRELLAGYCDDGWEEGAGEELGIAANTVWPRPQAELRAAVETILSIVGPPLTATPTGSSAESPFQEASVSMDTTEICNALLVMFRKNIDAWPILDGIAYGLSREGLTRLEIMRFYRDFMEISPSPFSQTQLHLVGDFCLHLLGQCNIDQIVRLYGDPEDPRELATKVYADARKWVPPP